jgi:hypothetical protein
MRLLLNLSPSQGAVRVEVRTVEPELTIAWQEITVDWSAVDRGVLPPSLSLALAQDAWKALRREVP